MNDPELWPASKDAVTDSCSDIITFLMHHGAAQSLNREKEEKEKNNPAEPPTAVTRGPRRATRRYGKLKREKLHRYSMYLEGDKRKKRVKRDHCAMIIKKIALYFIFS